MSLTEGRIEKRLRVSVSLELSKLQDPNSADQTVTENVCSAGARVLSRQAMEPDERLMVGFLELDLRADAHVIYCQCLSDGRFGVGLQFIKISKWLRNPLG